MPWVDCTYTLALDLPAPPNIMAPGPPPAFSISFLFIWLPMKLNSRMGSTNHTRKLTNGEPCSTISLEKVAPAAYSRSVRFGSFIRPVL